MKAIQIQLLCLSICTALFFSSCTKEEPGDNEKCGNIITWESNLLEHFVNGSIATDTNFFELIYEDLTEPQDICTEAPVEIIYTTEAISSDIYQVNMIKLRYKQYANLTYQNSGELIYYGTSDKIIEHPQINIDLEPIFGPTPGWLGVQVIAYVPRWFGTLDNAKNEMRSAFKNINLSIKYHAEK